MLKACLHRDLNVETFIMQPEGFRKVRRNWIVAELIAYGLNQMAGCWYNCFCSFIMSFDHRCEANHCAYFYDCTDGCFGILLFYVDDIIVARNSMKYVASLKTQFARGFDMKDLDVVSQISGSDKRKKRQENMVETKALRGKIFASTQHAKCKISEYSFSCPFKVIIKAMV